MNTLRTAERAPWIGRANAAFSFERSQRLTSVLSMTSVHLLPGVLLAVATRWPSWVLMRQWFLRRDFITT